MAADLAGMEYQRLRLEKLFDCLDALVVEWDAHGELVYANANLCALRRCTAADVIGRSIFDTLFPGKYADQWDRARMSFVRSIPVSSYKTTLPDTRGKEHVVLWTTALRTDASGRLNGVIAFGIEITELSMAMQSLKDLTRTLEKVFGIVAPA